MPINPKSFLYTHDTVTGVATIVLNRPQRMNALTFEVYRELGETFRDFADEPGVRAIVLTGQGKAFCTGGDVHDIIGPLLGRDADGMYEFTRMTCDVVEAMRACPRPIIAALNGTVAGAGAVLATAADLRVAAESARIAFLFTKVGLSGADMGMCWLLPRIVGFGRATELLMTGDFIDAAEAHRIGLYNRVVADDNVLEVALNLAEGLPSPAEVRIDYLITRLELHGQFGSDSYTVGLAGEGQALIEVIDKRPAEALDESNSQDLLTVQGTDKADNFLVRPLAVFALNSDATKSRSIEHLERISFDGNVNRGLVINGREGDDHFTLDDNATITTINGDDTGFYIAGDGFTYTSGW